ncbi:lipopolysaccharide heptosyltransferase II [Ectothiorhodospiraceae bacterium BW-2]|nr:lipopolysaccharide heptosyltransferase II [Ectothiorhodospiraceae bacterium BW-2]
MVMAQSLFISLKQRHSGALIDVVAPPWSLPLLQRMPEVDRALPLAVGHGQFGWSERYRLGSSLRQQHYQQAITLPRAWKAALIPWLAQTPLRTGYRGEMRYGLLNDLRPLNRRLLTQTVQRYVALGYPTNAPLPPPTPFPKLRVDREQQQQLRQRLRLASDSPAIALLTGAEYGPAKQWPAHHFATLAQQLYDRGYQLWLLGSAKDRPNAETITALSQRPLQNLCGKTSLTEAIDLLALCHCAVSNDSGLMHIAAAVGIQVVAIYGSSSPDYTPPLTPKRTMMTLKLPCSPCFKRHCPLGHTDCLQRLTPHQLVEALPP